VAATLTALQTMERTEFAPYARALSVPTVSPAEPNGRVEEKDQLTAALHAAPTPKDLADISFVNIEAKGTK